MFAFNSEPAYIKHKNSFRMQNVHLISIFVTQITQNRIKWLILIQTDCNCATLSIAHTLHAAGIRLVINFKIEYPGQLKISPSVTVLKNGTVDIWF